MPRSSKSAPKKPWGGKFEESAIVLRPSEVPDWLDFVGLLLRKFTELSLLATLVAVPMIYHFSLSNGGVEWIRGKIESQYFFMDQLGPWLMGLMPILESKFGVWLVLGLLMTAGYVVTQILEAATRRPILHPLEVEARASRAAQHRLFPLIAIALYLIYSLFSFLFWAPDVPPEAASLATPKEETFFTQLGGGGFFFSTVAWLQVTFGLVFFLVAEDVIRRRSLVNKILGIVVLVGLVNAITVILLKVEFGPLMSIWFKFGPADHRNNLGAFIGHNTGVSSFLMAPGLICLMWILTLQPRKSQTFRFAVATGFLLITLALILAQSRAVLPIVIACAVAMVLNLRRRACLIPNTRAYIWIPVAIAFVLLTQFVPNKFNRLYRDDVTFVERVGEFRPERLVTETRLRILAVSMTQLVPQNPLLGHGFGSFQYVYPAAQGLYFEKNPRTILSPTPLRTMRAHNEYLQLLVETGIIGLGIVLAGLFFLLKGGYIVMKRSLMPHHIAAQAGIFYSIVAILLHALVDFPLRVPPIAVTLVVLLAVWSAGDRLWVFPLTLPVEEDTLALRGTRESIDLKRAIMRPGLFAAAGACLLLLAIYGAAELFARTGNRFITAAQLDTRANSFLNSLQQNNSLLTPAVQDVRAAKRIFWISGPIFRTESQTNYYLAFMRYREADRLARENKLQQANKTREAADSDAASAITSLNLALQEEKFSSMYRLRANIFRLVAENKLSPSRNELMTQANLDLFRAVNMNPGDVDAMAELIRILMRNPSANRSEIVRYMGTMYYFHPQEFRSRIFGRVMDALALEETAEAYRTMALIMEAVPDEPDFRLASAQLATRAGQLEESRAIITDFLDGNLPAENAEAYREAAEMAQIELAIAQNNLEYALTNVQQASQFRHVPAAQLRVLELVLLKRLGENPEKQRTLRDAIMNLGRRNPINFQVAGATAYRYFPDWEEVMFWLEKRRNPPVAAPPMDLQGSVLLAKAYVATGQIQKAVELIPMIEGRGDTQYSRELAFQIAQQIRAAAAASASAAGTVEQP